MTQVKISSFSNYGATKLSAIDGKNFTIVDVVDAPYEDTPSVTIKTKETFEIDDTKYNRFYTTRKAIVSQLKSEQALQALANGDEIGPVRIVERISKSSKKKYFALEDVE